MHQSYAVTQIPENFNFPVNFLLVVKAAWDENHDAEIEYKEETNSSPRVSPLPENGAFAARPAFSILPSSTDLTCEIGGGNCLTLAEILRVAALPSKKLYRQVVVEVIGDGATLFVARRSSKLVPEIVVQSDQDQSVLTACDGFFTWYDDAGRLQHRFTRETIPPSSNLDTQRNSVSIASTCQHVDYVLQAFKFASGPSQLNKSPSSPLQDGLKLVEEVENKAGRFRAFCDGRIRVAFADRTILQVKRDGDLCSFFFADGSANQTTLASAPLRHRAYIYQAMEFGDWAFSTQEQRMKRHVERQEAQAIVARELQRISVCCRMSTGPRVLQRCSKGKAASHIHDVHDMNEKTPSLALSLAEVHKLQAATQQHIVSVDHALHNAAAFIAANHHTKK
uniref:C5orf34-like C-terminal domain-containing protein n=1 Tax=Hyaloperonospora arabidopsidis (strain Emoy2) TaxID=559515 RepID=M4C0N6_HYAAE